MKAVVIIPPVYDFYYTPHRASGLGGKIVSNLLQTKGCRVFLFNFPMQAGKGMTQELPSSLHYLKPYLIENETGKLSFFSQYRRFGPPVEECARQVLAHDPDLIFISCFAFCYADAAIDLARQIRKTVPAPLIICGGAGVSAHPEFFIRNPAIDYAFIGEAEVSVPLFVDIVTSGSGQFNRVPNLYYKSKEQIIPPSVIRHTESDEIVLALKKTVETSASVIFSTALSRGCPKACRFCSNFITHGRTFRVIPLEKIREVLAVFDKSRIDDGKAVYINFEDDNLLCDPDYFFSVLDIFKSVFPTAGFLAENGIDYTLLTPDLTKKLIHYGLKQFNLSMVSVDAEVLAQEKRDASLRLYESVIDTLKTHDIPCITYFICGLKNDHPEKVATTLAYLNGQPTRVGISLFYPVPGIPDFRDTSLFDGIDPCRCAGSSAYPWNQSLTTRQLVTAFRLSRFVNLLKSDRRTAGDDMMIEKSIQEQILYTQIKQRGHRRLIPISYIDHEMVRCFFTTGLL